MSASSTNEEESSNAHYDAIVVGAGFAGLYALHELRDMGMSVRVIDKGNEVGGTWHHNTYPGAHCDTESHIYCYSFSDELLNKWEYSKRFPGRDEIYEYFQFVADHFNFRKDIQFNTEVESVTFDENEGNWKVNTDNTPELSSHYLIFGLGPLSKPFTPDFDGLDKFDGEMYHAAKWPDQSVNFEGKNIGVIGTGSSGVQIIPEVAKTAEQLNVYQRTPNYVIPARNCERDEEFWKETRENYDEIWEKVWNSVDGHPYDHEYETVEGLSDDEVQDVLEERWQQGGFRFFHTFKGLLSDKETNDRVCQFIESKVRERLDDKDLADKLIPEPDDHPYGAKRPPLSYDDYYQTYQRDNVNLIDVDEAPIEKFTKKGIETTEDSYEQDMIILATGFDAITGAYKNIDITGRNNSRIKEKWGSGPCTYLGFSVDEFPNMFMITGPQSVAALTNQPPAIEHQINWVTECIEYLEKNNLRYIEASQESVEEWVELSSHIAEQTLFTEADSWYIGANIPGKSRVFLPFLGGFPDFQERVESIAENDYEGFRLAESLRGLRSSQSVNSSSD